MKSYRTFRNVVHATPSLAEAMERFRRTGEFVLSTSNPSAFEFENTLPGSLDLSRVSPYKRDAFVDAAVGDNSQVKSVPASGIQSAPDSVGDATAPASNVGDATAPASNVGDATA